ncbi:MAG TPA: hypothetical protein VGK67_26145 [Myxococcales bacterium]
MHIAANTRLRRGFAVLVALAGLLPAFGAQAQRLEWLAPGRVPPAPFRVGLVALDAAGQAADCGQARVSANGGKIEEGAREGAVRTFFVVPAGPEPVALEARDGALVARAQVELGHPSARVELKAVPEAPIKGKDTSAALEIAVLRGDGSPDPTAAPPVLRASVGEIREVAPLGAGRFKATYLLPKERYPEVAIVVAFAPWPHADSSDGAFGVLAVPLSSSVVLPGKTEKNATIAIEIAGKTFGPVPADAQGAFQVPIVAPPGHRFGAATTIDRLGNKRTKQLDLHLPPTDQIGCVTSPTALPADGVTRARILCLATDPYGKPVAGAKITAKASLGRLEGPVPRGEAYEWQYTAPLKSDAESDVVLIDYPAGGPQSKERAELRFRPLPLATTRVEVLGQPVFVGGATSVVVKAKDREGRPVEVRPELKAKRGELGAFERTAPGEVRARYRPPRQAGDWKDELVGAVLGEAGKAPARLRISNAGSRVQVRAEDIAGYPVEGLALELGKTRLTTGRNGIAQAELAPAPESGLEVLDVQTPERRSLSTRFWRLRTAKGLQGFPEEGPFEAAALAVPVALAPATPVDVQIEFVSEPAPGGLKASVVDVSGRVVPGRELSWTVTASGGPVPTSPSQEQPDGSLFIPFARKASGAVSASVCDVASGVTAAQEANLP